MNLRLLLTLFILTDLYLVGYLAFRFTHIERSPIDFHDYVIFPAQYPALYYFFRPLSYADGQLTGMRFHIGPHR